MKTLILLLLITIITPHVFGQQQALQQSEVYYKQGITAESAGDPDKAIASYKAALHLNPKNANARYRLGQVKTNRGSIKEKGSKAKFDKILIPQYTVENAPLSEAVELLSLLIEKQSEGKITPNFVIEDPDGKITNQAVNIQLKNIPASAILKFIHSQTNTIARYDEHAVIIKAR